MSSENVPEIDELSRQLIIELQENGRASFRELGDKLGVAPNTVRARFKQLQDQGIIDIIAVPNPAQMGLTFHATIGLRVEPGQVEQAVALLERRADVGWIGLILNHYDIMFEIAARNAAAFGRLKEELFAEITGFIEADVFMMWDIRKFRYLIAPEGSDQSL
ncbi:MAG: AsnC family transcriptional regulator [Parvibaculaceae bacterium]|nr:AsnC family transcriptional regulator [Parvibaculaceae bacterium]